MQGSLPHSLQRRPVPHQPLRLRIVAEIDFLDRHHLSAIAHRGQADGGGAVVVGGGFGFRERPVGDIATARGERQRGGFEFGLAGFAEGGGGFVGAVEQ